jgi:hypothetical protein
VLVALLPTLFGCGGGGGGGGFIGAALVSVDASPRKVDPGKRVQVRVQVNEVHRDGVFLKIRYPSGFSYAVGTAILTEGSDKRTIQPAYNLLSSAEDEVYLVFNTPRPYFGADNQGELVLELNAESEVRSGKIEIDADVNDPTVPDDKEFKVANPEFDPQDSVDVTVVD